MNTITQQTTRRTTRNIFATLIAAACVITTPAHAACEYVVSNHWGDGFTASIKITNNTSTAVNQWNVAWQYNSNQRITNHWNTTLSGTNPYSASNASWNGHLQPGQSAELGFQGTKGAGAPEIPVVTGTLCAGAASSSSVRSSASSVHVSSSHSSSSSEPVALIEARNPVIWADVPDPSVIRVDNTYYMTSTTMHMSPGVPIMKSTDLVNWTLINYAYSTLANNAQLNLDNGQHAYGKGSWASSIRYVDGTFYVSTFSYSTNRTYIYRTNDIENGPWTTSVLNGLYHDSALFFENGRVFMVYGVDDIKLIELTADASAIRTGGINQTIIPRASAIAGSNFYVPAEGAHLQKINGRYYISLISWPVGSGRSQLIYRSNNLTGPYEGRIALQDQGVAQGNLIDTPTGDWYAFLFKDNGAVGRIPYLVPVRWQDGWPVMGVNGRVPQPLGFTVENHGLKGIVTSDEFNQGQQGHSRLPLQWQWNHNPDNTGWSLQARPGFMRLTNTRRDTSLLNTRNTLTQRTFGPQSSARVAMETAGMRDGDYAGLGALQARYGYVGVTRSGGHRSIIMVDTTSGSPQEIERISLNQDRVYFKIDMDFRNQTDQARFFYSLDGTNWRAIGNTLRMTYDLAHFMGYRFALFNYATQSTGGYVDFDYYRLQ